MKIPELRSGCLSFRSSVTALRRPLGHIAESVAMIATAIHARIDHTGLLGLPPPAWSPSFSIGRRALIAPWDGNRPDLANISDTAALLEHRNPMEYRLERPFSGVCSEVDDHVPSLWAS
jgi:hypothetical protein